MSKATETPPAWASWRTRSSVTTLIETARRFGGGDWFRVGRYFIAGVGVSLGYTVTVVALVEWLGWRNPTLANTVSFLLWTPVSYFVHREFTFRFDGEMLASALKFFVTFVVKLVASVAVMILTVEVLGWHYIVGVLANWIALPLIAYVVLALWVFRGTARSDR